MQAQCFSIEQMMSEYSVPADTAFCLFRSLFLQKVAVSFLFISPIFYECASIANFCFKSFQHLFEASIEKSDDDDKSVSANKVSPSAFCTQSFILTMHYHPKLNRSHSYFGSQAFLGVRGRF